MTETEVSSQGAPPSRVEASTRAFMQRMWGAVVTQKLLVAAILVAGVLDAVCAKGIYLLIGPLIDSLTGRKPMLGDGFVGPPLPPADAEAVFVGPTAPPEAASMLDRLNVAVASLSQWLQDSLGVHFLIGGKDLGIFITCAVISVAMSVVGAVALYWVSTLTRYFGAKVVVAIRDEVAAHILHLPMRYFGQRKMGELISNVTTDTAVLLRTFSLALDNAVLDPLMVLMNFTIVVVVVPDLWWVLLIMVPAMAIPLVRLGKKVRKRSSRSLAAMGDATESLNQMLTGFRTVKAYQLEERRLEDFAGTNARFLQRTLTMFRARAMSQAVTFFAYQLGFGVMLVALGWLVLGGSYAAGELAVLTLPLTTTYMHVKRMARAWNTLMESVGAYEGIEALLQQPLDADKDQGVPLVEVAGAVEFDNVSFDYGDDAVVCDLSFEVAPGKTVALVGPSGAGKSTTLDLLARFHDPRAGRILIDGRDLRTLKLSDFRRRLAIVSQQPFLFNTTVYENILLGRPGATRAEVLAAAQAAHIHDFILTLPRGYDTVCGERGANLSGGQMQRITIARAVLRDPAVLILDEATSALDSESEKAVQEALANLMQGRTSFVIAHRLSTIRAADLILVMDRGRLVESGKHDDLLERGGLYHRLNQLQQV